MTPLLSIAERPITSIADAHALETAARRSETAWGADGPMVWHRWGVGSPVVLLHGGSGSWNHWVRNIAPLVRAGHQVLAPDLPGFGDSAQPSSGRDADALPPWVERGLAELLGSAACDVVGFSFGGMVAGLLAAQWPQRVRRLVLVGAPALAANPGRTLGLKSWQHLAYRDERQAAIRFNLRQLMLAHDTSVDDLALALHTENLVRDRMQRRVLSKTDILLRTLPQIECPVFGIWGEQDALYRERIGIIGPALAQAPLFQSLTLVRNAGHWVQYEDAPAFNVALVDALSAPVVGSA